MKLQFFSRGFVTSLQQTAAANVQKYGQGTGWLDDLAAGQRYIHESNYVVEPPPALVISDEPTNDAENARRVFNWLRHLTPAVAMELRLWSHLTHYVFSDYMRARWPAVTETLVQRRYLFEGNSFAALSRNGISRLWWAAYLTRDEKRGDPFQLTDILFLRQDIQVAVLERAMGKCRAIRVALLEFVRDNQGWLSEQSFGRRIQFIAKEVNLLGGVAVLDAVPDDEIRAFLQKVGASIAGGKESVSAMTA
jgi:hypothetical protein